MRSVDRLLWIFFVFALFPLLWGVEPLFDSWINYPMDPQPRWVAKADLDGDGDLDLVVCTQLASTVIIMKNEGNGTFRRDTVLQGRGTPWRVAAKDLDGNGCPDIVTLNRNTGKVSIFKCRGLGAGYELPFECNVGPGPFDLVVDSLVRDSVSGNSFLDLAVSNRTEGTLSLLYNHGAGTFPVESTKQCGQHPSGETAIDLDGDGDKDLAALIAVADTNKLVGLNGLVLTYQKAKGSYDDSNRVTYRIADSLPLPHSLIAADFDRDGDEDLALTLSSTSASAQLCVLLNTGNSARPFGTDLNNPGIDRYSAGDSGQALVAVDIDGDGDLDIAAGNLADNTISVYKNDGGGNFAPRVSYASPASPASIAAGDFDFDLDIDLAVTSVSTHSLGVMPNDGDGDFPTGTTYLAGPGRNPRGIAAADLDADGDRDLAITLFNRNHIQLFRNDGPGSGLAARPSFGAAFGGSQKLRSPRTIAAGDIDGDTDLDLVVGNQEYDSIVVFKNSGHPNLDSAFRTPASFYRAGKFVYSLILRDLDADGDLDLATANFGAGTVTVLKNDGTGGFGLPFPVQVGFRPNSITAADFDLDGDWDLAVSEAGQEGLASFLSVLFNDGTGNFPIRTSHPVGIHPLSITAADLNADGFADLLAGNHGDGVGEDHSVSVLINTGDGSGSFFPQEKYEAALKPSAGLLAADLDGDNDLDIVSLGDAANAATILFNDGSGVFPARTDYGCGFTPFAAAAADLDGDGDLELAVTNDGSTVPQSGAVTVLKNLSQNPCGLRGDLSGDGVLDAVDVVRMMNCVFGGFGICTECRADVNCDGLVTPVDLVLLLRRVFAGAPLPC